MKWLKFLRAARKRALEGGAETGDDGSPHKHSKRRSMQHERKERTSIEQWHEARKTRTSIDICTAFNVTTTERLSVCKAGITLLINRTYIVIKHLGSGSSGQVKLAFNLRSKKLVAIKAVRKGSYGGGGSHGMLGGRDARSYDGRSSHGSLGRGGGLTASHSVGLLTCGLGGSSCGSAGGGGNGGGGRGWRSITPSSLLRRSNSSGLGSSTVNGSSIGGRSPAASSPSPPPLRCYPGTQNISATGDAAAKSAAEAVCGPAEDFVREIAILKRLSHPNIVQLVEVIDDPASDCLLLVMGYVEGSTLQPQQLQLGRWRPVPEEVVWRYARDVLCGLEYLHCHGVVHGDLKPANFIQDSLTGVVRILDFGSAVLHGRVVGEEGLRGAHVPMSCTPGFRSPESLAAGYRPSFELDMWALGVCIYLWAFGELPFKGSAPFVVYENIRSAPLVIPTITRISTQLTDLMTRLLDKNPVTRMTVHEAVTHPWTTAQGLAPLRTPSPLVMAARLQLGMHLASAAATGSQIAFGSRAFIGAISDDPDQRKPESWLQGHMPLDDHQCTATATAAVSTAMTDNTSSLTLRQSAGSATGTGNAVPTPPLLSCSSSSANLSTSIADTAAAAADLLVDPVRRGGTPVPAAAASSAGRDGPMEPWTVAAAAAPPPHPAARDRPWRMSATTTPTVSSPARSLTGMAAMPHMSPTTVSPFAGWPMPRIAEGGSTGNTGSLGPGLAVAMAGGGSTGGRRNSSEVWELRRSVTDEELQAAISSCCDPTGSAAVLMESIFSEVIFPAKQQIICAGDPLDRIYLITAGEVEIYHDLMQDGPDAPCPHKPIIEGLSDPESELDDPGDFLNIRMPGSNVPQLERLSTGLLNFTAGGDRSNHGASHAAAALAAAFGSTGDGNVPSPGPSAPASASGYTPAPPQVASPCVAGTGTYGGSGMVRAASASRATLTGLGGGVATAAGGKGSGGREPSGSSVGLFSRGGTQTGHLIVAVKGPGDSLGFAGMLPGGSCSGGGGSGASAPPWTAGGGGAAPRQPVWSANVRARTQVTAFVASIESLHKLARAHPQVEQLLQQISVQQETDLAVAEAMRSLRLVGGAEARGAAVAPAITGAGASASASAGPPSAPAVVSASIGASGNAEETVTAVVPVAAGAATSVTHVGGAGSAGCGGVSSEGECESCGTAAMRGAELVAEGSPGDVLPQAMVSSVLEWHRRPNSNIVEQNIACRTWGPVVGGGGCIGTGGAGGPYDMVESNENVEGVEDVMMMSGEIL